MTTLCRQSLLSVKAQKGKKMNALNRTWDKLIAQGLMAGIANAVTTAIVGSLLCVAYAATKTKAGSLSKED